MSLILDALNRADRERKNTQVTPDINTVHEATYRPSARAGSKTIFIGVVVLLLIVVILLSYHLLKNTPPAEDEVKATSTQKISPSSDLPLPSAEPVQQTVPASNPAVVKESESARESVTRQTKQTARANATPDEVKSLYAKEMRELSSQQKAKQETSGKAKVEDLYKPVEEPAKVESVALPQQEITPVSLLEPSTTTYAGLEKVPDLSQLPTALQQEIPSIRYSQHNFSADGVSNVVINGQPRLARTMLAEQLSLDEIYVDGILLRFREHKFKLRALNNWVNM